MLELEDEEEVEEEEEEEEEEEPPVMYVKFFDGNCSGNFSQQPLHSLVQ